MPIDPTPPTRMTGTVRRIVADRGFAFVRGSDGRDYFVHYTEVTNAKLAQLAEGDRLAFNAIETPKGLRAVEVERV